MNRLLIKLVLRLVSLIANRRVQLLSKLVFNARKLGLWGFSFFGVAGRVAIFARNNLGQFDLFFFKLKLTGI